MKKLKIFVTTGLFCFAHIVGNAQVSSLHVQGSLATTVTTTSANLALDGTHQVVLVNSASSRNITLPSAAGIAGRIYTVKKIGTGNVNLIPQSGQVIDGAGSFIIFGSNSFLSVVSDDSNWWVIARD